MASSLNKPKQGFNHTRDSETRQRLKKCKLKIGKFLWLRFLNLTFDQVKEPLLFEMIFFISSFLSI